MRVMEKAFLSFAASIATGAIWVLFLWLAAISPSWQLAVCMAGVAFACVLIPAFVGAVPIVVRVLRADRN